MILTWLPGKIVRFKSDHSDEEAREMEEALHGRCKRTGQRELTITKTVRWILDAPPRDVTPRDVTPRIEREEVIDFGSNGHAEAGRLVRS